MGRDEPAILEEVTLQHFRSFGPETKIRFAPGLNIVCGGEPLGLEPRPRGWIPRPHRAPCAPCSRRCAHSWRRAPPLQPTARASPTCWTPSCSPSLTTRGRCDRARGPTSDLARAKGRVQWALNSHPRALGTATFVSKAPAQSLTDVRFDLIAQPCAVRVRIRGGPTPPGATSAAPPPLVLMAHLKDESSRALKINGAVATVQGVREALVSPQRHYNLPSRTHLTPKPE